MYVFGENLIKKLFDCKYTNIDLRTNLIHRKTHLGDVQKYLATGSASEFCMGITARDKIKTMNTKGGIVYHRSYIRLSNHENYDDHMCNLIQNIKTDNAVKSKKL